MPAQTGVSGTEDIRSTTDERRGPVWAGDTALLVYLAAATVLVHLLTGGRYGFNRDELATLDDARHLAWGYVVYPPVTPFFGRLSLVLFGTSLVGFRFFAALAEAAAVVVTGLMARELGGGRGAQLLSATAAVPFCLAAGALMQYVSFDYLFWVFTAYFTLRLLKSGDPRWWIAIGAAIGLGLMSKYAIVFFVAGLLGGLLLTPARRYLASRWFWMGVALALLIFLPNLIWQAQHHFISLAALRHIHTRDVGQGRAKNFVPNQLRLTLLASPLWLAGLWFYLFSERGRRYRTLGWMYVIPLLLFVIAKGRPYYLAAAYPMLYAGGAVWGEAWLRTLGRGWRWTLRALAWTAVAADAVFVAAVTLPIAPVNSQWGQVAFAVNGDLREELGWQEMAATVSLIRDHLPPADRAHLGILAQNYGEAGALSLYGPRYGLPRPISGVNSFWYHGYGDPPPETLIVIGQSRDFVQTHFQSCRVAGVTWNKYGIENEETRAHHEIYVCRGLKQSWPEFWKTFQNFG